MKDRVQQLYEKCALEFPDGLDAMSEEMLRKFCRASVQIEDINARLAEEGVMVETEKGPKENPLVNTVHKLSSDMARYYGPLKRWMMKQQQAKADQTELDDFLGI